MLSIELNLGLGIKVSDRAGLLYRLYSLNMTRVRDIGKSIMSIIKVDHKIIYSFNRR